MVPHVFHMSVDPENDKMRCSVHLQLGVVIGYYSKENDDDDDGEKHSTYIELVVTSPALD